MDIALQRRALKALEAALDQPDDARDLWVEETLGAEPELLAAVRKLLRGDAAGAGALPTELPRIELPPERPPPERIGPYRLTRLLGRGGMSAVYLGERDDGLFDHAVAVKLMSAGLFPGAMRGLFDLERRILARLKHPNIAQLFDGGVGEDGSPYFVMEMLTGAAIDDYARDRRLSPHETVRLFLQVCSAVSHAHQNLVAHADIKPSNVLVGDEGVAKLLDFGIAQLIEDTREGGAPGDGAAQALPVTPAYASPQRLAGERPTPSDDVYSLGALLHDLLALVPAIEGRRGAPSEASRAAGDDAAERRARIIAGDLDAIALKAMSPDPGDRYGSVEALAQDLNRWLDRRPVLARHPDWRMATSRYVQRHPWAVAAAAAAMIGLVGALAVTTSLYVEAARARQAAETRFAEVRGMAKYLLFDLYDGLDRTPQSLALRRDVARRGQAYLDSLAVDASAPIEVRVEAIEGLTRLAAVQGGPGHSNLGDTNAARANLSRAARFAAALAAAHPDRADVWLALAKAEMEAAGFHSAVDGATAAADLAMARAGAAIARARGLAHTGGALADTEVQWNLRAAELRQWQGRYPESVALAKAALADLAARPEAVRRSVAAHLLTARAWDTLGESTYYGVGEAAAEAPYVRAVQILEEAGRQAPDDPVVLRALVRAKWALGSTQVAIGKADQALTALDPALADARRLIAFDARDEDARRVLRVVELARAQALAGARRFPEAIAAMAAQVAERRAIWLRDPGKAEAARDLAISVAGLGDIYADAGRNAEACATYDQGLEAFDQLRRRGRLTILDQDHGLPLLQRRSKAACGR